MKEYKDRIVIYLANCNILNKTLIPDIEFFKPINLPIKIENKKSTGFIINLKDKNANLINFNQDNEKIKKEFRSLVEHKIDLLRLYKLTLLDFWFSELIRDNYIFYLPKPNYYILYNMHDFTNNLFSLDKREIIKLKKFWALLPNTPQELSNSVKYAIVNHRLSFFAPLLMDKLTYLITAYESLYLKGVYHNLTKKLAKKASVVIGKFFNEPDSKDKVFEFIKICYNLRSRIVHGEILSNLEELNDYAKKEDEYFNSNSFYDLWINLEKFLRISIQFFIRNDNLLSKKEFEEIYNNPIDFENYVEKFYLNNIIIIC